MAKYKGKSRRYAQKVLDESQNGKSHPDGRLGHPRGHASYPKSDGQTESVENYSKHTKKTGFLSRADQDLMVHWTLKTPEAQDMIELMDKLGKKTSRESLHILTEKLQIPEKKIPMAQNWQDGRKIGKPWKIKKISIVLKHYYERYDDENEDVLVFTVYPARYPVP